MNLSTFPLGLAPPLGDAVAALRTMSPAELPFDVWKLRLQADCKRENKLLVYSNLDEECLRVLWEAGTEPSVQGIIDGGQPVS